ncbi:MAG: 3'-_5' ssDNA/RNA exonuclease TatD [Candidatus Midichloria mitochondrii]|uniref:Mg-dependent DNase n=1 Tax=Midichloria mitochondrii (strain IricVA) TaxID=696127 RepID=F7XVY5_MIDMI|nr:TatD family hydrolase [Candidatus Midichloria mitochondrii]AEI88834.1 Mg-dependent DNase [Candidatus Midichloria mitochondrii IricVA]MDJ1256489.1 TatD family hydrolase [Candidatus Midichloria mitochondrii]MDJ1288204.1 TatD family hydrolase [Candidatus Midichloria mitochondrii]MDJ1299070.1 TatD family hydrolase [Candidatus Midichloria mitochondrii]MDJ1312987.1 TatD family hydrolase [Candidatus Midichloria mitochondrii]
MLIDSHCHLDFEELNKDLELVVQRALKLDVAVLQTICTQISKFKLIYEVAEKYSNIYCSVGNHPLYLKEEGVTDCASILEFCRLSKVIGIGETGLDYYHTDFDKLSQKKSFIEHIKASQACGLPIIIHTRSADDDTLGILREQMQEKSFTGVIHCFTASRGLANACIDMGLYISASGILTFRNATDIQQTFKELPEDRIIIETDAPFLAPSPFRGKVNEPSYLTHTALFLANLRSKSFQEIAKITTDNFFRLFTKVGR